MQKLLGELWKKNNFSIIVGCRYFLCIICDICLVSHSVGIFEKIYIFVFLCFVMVIVRDDVDAKKIEDAKRIEDARKNEEAKKIEEVLIQVGLRIAKRGDGALFVVGDVNYKPLVDQSVPSFDVCSNPKLLESLALMDGAVIIGMDGMMKAYGVRVKSGKVFKNYGTRHSAAISSAKGDNLVVIVSEEDKKIRILRKGKMVMQIDALQKNVEKSVNSAIDILESIGAGTVGTIGTSLLVPSIGLALLPGILVFGSAYYLGKLMKR